MRFLWLAPYPLIPAHGGGSIRVTALADEVKRAGHQLDLWCVSPEFDSRTAEIHTRAGIRTFLGRDRVTIREKLGCLASGLPEGAWLCRSLELDRELAALDSGEYDLVVLHQGHLISYVERLNARFPVVLDAHNLEADLVRGIADRESRRRTRLRQQLEALRFSKLERSGFIAVDAVFSVSKEEAAVIHRLAPSARIEVHPSGTHLSALVASDRDEAAHSPVVLFVGTLGFPPNSDGLQWFLSGAWPEIRRAHPSALLRVVGRDAPRWLTELATESLGVDLVGEVADVDPFYRSASVVLIPLRIGSGTRLKAVEAMARSVPIVSTGVGMAGIEATPGTHYLKAESAKEMADGVTALLRNRSERLRLADSALRLVTARYSWKKLGASYARSLAIVADEGRIKRRQRPAR